MRDKQGTEGQPIDYKPSHKSHFGIVGLNVLISTVEKMLRSLERKIGSRPPSDLRSTANSRLVITCSMQVSVFELIILQVAGSLPFLE
jgi:hypothetical protein